MYVVFLPILLLSLAVRDVVDRLPARQGHQRCEHHFSPVFARSPMMHPSPVI